MGIVLFYVNKRKKRNIYCNARVLPYKDTYRTKETEYQRQIQPYLSSVEI